MIHDQFFDIFLLLIEIFIFPSVTLPLRKPTCATSGKNTKRQQGCHDGKKQTMRQDYEIKSLNFDILTHILSHCFCLFLFSIESFYFSAFGGNRFL